MKIKHILTAMLALAAVSCEQAKFGLDEPVSDNMLKVRFSPPELEVKSGSEDVSFYAYITSELKDGIIAPIAATMEKEDGYLYYNIPEGTTDVIFSNIGSSDQDVYITSEDGRVVFKTRDEHSAHIYNEIFYAELNGITIGTSSQYNVPVKRLTSIVHSELHYIDSNGDQVATDNIDFVNVFYHGWGTSMNQNADGTFTGKSYDMQIGFGASHAINATDETGRVFIPGEQVPDVQVEIQFTDGTNKRYRTSLGKAFEPNHRYNVLLRLRQINAEGNFILEEPSVSTTNRNPSYSQQDFFSLSEGRTVGGFADDVLTIDVSTALPYDWYITYPEEADAFFDIQVINGQIVIRALAANENDIRSVDIEIRTNEGYTKTITVNQKSSLKHRIVMTSETDYRNYWITLSGENVTVTDAAGNTRTEAGSFTNLRFDFTNPGLGSQVVIEGDIITYMDGLGWTDQDARYHYDFENCTYLAEIRLRTDSETLDLTGLPSLKTVNTVNSCYKSVLLDENQGITYFRCQNNDDITDLNLRNIAQSIETIDCSDCNSLIRNLFTNFTNLKTINIDNCTSSSVINLTGCSSLEEFSVYNNKASMILITNCTSLKTMTLNSMNLTSGISHEGADAITTINTDNTTISTFNFAGKPSLESVGAMNSSTFDVNGCTALSTLGKISGVSTLNISNCTALTSIDIDLNMDGTQALSYENCTALENVTLNNINMQHDYSPLYSLKNIHIDNIGGSENTVIDLSNNTMLKSAYIGGYWTGCNINSLLLPQSIEKLDINRLHNITDISLSGYANLKKLMMYEIRNLNTLDLTYCPVLETLDMRYCFFDYTNNTTRMIDLTGCSTLKDINKSIEYPECYYLNSINLTECYSLQSCNLYNSSLTSIDFSYCSRLNQFDLRYNSLESDAITLLIASLPDWSIIDDGWNSGAFRLSGNPGYDGYDFTYANLKYWYEIAN